MTPSRIIIVALLALMAGESADVVGQATSPPLWSGLSPGPFGVGYRRIDVPGTTVHVWYPAAGNGPSLRFTDYLGADREQTATFLTSVGVASSTVDSLFESPVLAVASALPIGHAVPLVLIAHGNGHDAADQAILSEYIASHGFVVASTPSPMRQTPMEREDQVAAFAERQASALEAVGAVVAGVIPVDTMRIGIIGHSFGARAALLLAMRNGRVRALVSLDGGIGTATVAEAFRQAPSFDSLASLPPILHFYEELDAFMAPDFQLLRSLDTEALVLEPTSAIHHVHFTTYGFAAVLLPGIGSVTRATADTRSALIEVAERTARFLRDNLLAVP